MLNALIKIFFFWRTNKGGGRGSVRSKLILIGQLLHRRFFWICNLVPTNMWNSELEINDVIVEANDNNDDTVFDLNKLVVEEV